MSALFRSTAGVRVAPRYRSITISSVSAKVPEHSIYASQSKNPYFNLSCEDWLFKSKPPKDPLLFVYRDDPCVVIGRNQNPWKEINLPALREANIPFIRRRSGGGTVFHDTGNTNFSIHLPRTTFDRHATAQVVLRAVRSLDIDAHVNDRNDICVGPYKISSAYKIVNNRAYHHGTMLIATELGTLGDVLHVNKESMVTRGVASVRSPVRNLCWFQPDITHETFVDAVVQSFQKEYGVNDDVHDVKESEEFLSIPYIRDGMAELPRWDWSFGQTPEFTYALQRSFSWGNPEVHIRSKHGLILECKVEVNDERLQPELAAFASSLSGKRYGFMDEHIVEGHSPVAEFSAWLVEELRK